MSSTCCKRSGETNTHSDHQITLNTKPGHSAEAGRRHESDKPAHPRDKITQTNQRLQRLERHVLHGRETAMQTGRQSKPSRTAQHNWHKPLPNTITQSQQLFASSCTVRERHQHNPDSKTARDRRERPTDSVKTRIDPWAGRQRNRSRPSLQAKQQHWGHHPHQHARPIVQGPSSSHAGVEMTANTRVTRKGPSHSRRCRNNHANGWIIGRAKMQFLHHV